MRLLGINSRKYGCFIVMYSDSDHDLISGFKWNIHKNKVGKFYARTVTKKVTGKKESITMHRMIMGFPSGLVDHKNRYTLDNTRENLRIANASQNRMNCDYCAGASKYKGVDIYLVNGKFRVRIAVNRKTISGGYFHDEIQAAKKYNELALKYHGEFATLNEV